MTEAYLKYITSRKWRAKSESIKALDNYTCWICGYNHKAKPRSGKWREVHHLTYERLGNEHENDLLTLCNKCHSTIKDIMTRGWNREEAFGYACKYNFRNPDDLKLWLLCKRRNIYEQRKRSARLLKPPDPVMRSRGGFQGMKPRKGKRPWPK